ncbi:MAG: TetR family transcriptional regulator [Actinomycetota bacterium]|nr:TetR family transcriptional regulator [Actinomycetota bacterium]
MADARQADAVRPIPAYVGQARALRRRSLLDTGLNPLLAHRPWASIRMADVAASAGVSRQTIYAEFGSRQGLAEAYVVAETERFLGMVDAALEAGGSDPRAALSAAMATFLAAARDRGLLRAIVNDDGNHDLLTLITTRGEGVLDAAGGHLARFFHHRWPTMSGTDAHLAARCLVRLALSYATRPDGPPAEAAEEVATLLGPFLDGAIARGADKVAVD